MGRWMLVVAATAAVLALRPVAAHAAFPGQNGLVATSDLAAEIDFRDPDGSGLHNYCGTTLLDQCGYPAFSADGKTLAASITGTFPDFVEQLWTGPVSGKLTKKLVEFPSGTIQAAWSPDDRQIVFGYDADDPANVSSDGLWLVNANGGGLHRLTTSGSLPSWSPLGDRIAYTCGGPRTGVGICTIRPDGGGFVQLTADGTEPDWSPDGSQIAFANGRLFATGDEIEVMTATGSNRHTVIGHVGDLPEGSGYSTQTPRWSPDGTRILFAGSCNYNGGAPTSGCLWTVDPNGGNLTEIGGSAQHVYRGMLAWQPVPVAPSVLSPPNVSGSLVVGDSLTADASASFAGTGLKLGYRWFACPGGPPGPLGPPGPAPPAGAPGPGGLPRDCRPIPSGKSATLVIPRSAKNRRLVVEVAATNVLGSVSVRSTPTEPVRKR